MDEKEYRKFVDNLQKKDLDIFDPMIIFATIGIAGEGGEILDNVKRAMCYGVPFDVKNCKEEMGDLLFYMTILMNKFNCSIEDLRNINSQKLLKRFPLGYTDEAAVVRADKNAEKNSNK